MQGIFRKENTDKALKYGIYRHLPTYEKIIRNLVSFLFKKLKYLYSEPDQCQNKFKLYFNEHCLHHAVNKYRGIIYRLEHECNH